MIVNWRTAELVCDCLRSLSPEISALKSCKVVVVDNDSQDGSADAIECLIDREDWAGWARVIRAESNLGFAAGNNTGIRDTLAAGSSPDFILLLNPDTYIRPGAVTVLADFLLKHESVGIVGGRSEDPDGTPQHCCFRFPNIVSEAADELDLGIIDRLATRYVVSIDIPEAPMQVDWVSGAAMMVRTELFEQIGLMDESFFLYYEETDFAFRASRAGWACWHVPQSRVVHLVGQSSGIEKRGAPPMRVPSYWFESRRRFFLLNHGLPYTVLTDLLVVFACVLSGLRGAIQRGRRRRAPGYFGDFLRNSVLMKGRGGLSPRKTAM